MEVDFILIIEYINTIVHTAASYQL